MYSQWAGSRPMRPADDALGTSRGRGTELDLVAFAQFFFFALSLSLPEVEALTCLALRFLSGRRVVPAEDVASMAWGSRHRRSWKSDAEPAFTLVPSLECENLPL